MAEVTPKTAEQINSQQVLVEIEHIISDYQVGNLGLGLIDGYARRGLIDQIRELPFWQTTQLRDTMQINAQQIEVLALKAYPGLRHSGFCSRHRDAGFYECNICYPDLNGLLTEHMQVQNELYDQLLRLSGLKDPRNGRIGTNAIVSELQIRLGKLPDRDTMKRDIALRLLIDRWKELAHLCGSEAERAILRSCVRELEAVIEAMICKLK